MSVVLDGTSLWETPDGQLVLSHSASVFCFHPTVEPVTEGGCDLGGCSASGLLGCVCLEGGWRCWWCCSHLETHEESCSQESLYQRGQQRKMFPLRRASLDCVLLARSWERGSAKALFQYNPDPFQRFPGCVGAPRPPVPQR